MKHSTAKFIGVLLLSLAAGICPAQVVISEFMAMNDDSLTDGDGNSPDWIELYNMGSGTVDLTGWYLSDNTNNLIKWIFPSASIGAGERLVVFASGQDTPDYTDGLNYLHTTFKLAGSGESVVLTRPDGVTVENVIADYPVQSEDVSYGIPQETTYATLIAENEDAKALIPTSDAESTNWHLASYDDTGWLAGQQGVGYNYSDMIGLNVSSMRWENSSVYVRIAFDIQNAQSVSALSLRAKFNDGFVAYLNGVEIARDNAPSTLAWDSKAAMYQPANLNSYIDFEIKADSLQDGANILAIQGMNYTSGSVDLLIQTELHAVVAGDVQTNGLEYLPTPTPGRANVDGFIGYVADTKFTVDRGFFTDAFETAISCATEDSAIYYTLDGTTPTADNGTLYTNPITIDRTTVLRATAVKTNYRSSDPDTQTYIFVADVMNQSSDPSSEIPEWPTSSVNGQVFDYEMDPDVMNDARYTDLIDDALLDIPSISVVTDPDNLFDADTGIYVNATDDGPLWERATSVELINPDGTDGFQINGGIRIRGGVSRDSSNPKHSFRFFFRSEYGAARLNFPLFGDEGADSFKRMDIRTAQNFSWSYGDNDAAGTWLYDIFTRDAHREMGQPYTRGRFYHLYINGLYWGLYQTEERPTAHYAETYCGGDNDDYDVIKSSDYGIPVEASDGVLTNYHDLWSAVNAGVSSASDYFSIQGMNPDGTRNESYTRLLDVDNLIDYMLCVFWSGNRDSPLGRPGDHDPRNLFAFYNRSNPDGFKFVAHDGENCLGYHLSAGVNYNAITQYDVLSYPKLTSQDFFNPWWLHLMLMENDEYKIRFADRVQKHFFNGGVLTAENASALFSARKSEMDLAIIAESARWGDYRTNTPRTKHDDWLPAVNSILNDYIQASPINRTEVVRDQIVSQNWYPLVSAPEFNQHGGRVISGFALSISGSGTIYYTTDGSDPRAIGGGVAGTAYNSVLTLDKSTQVKARVLSGGTWSALTDATFVLAEGSPLRVTEIMYNPADPISGPEFIELLNTGSEEIGLAGTEFTEGIRFEFYEGDVATLAPGEYAVLVSDYTAFTNRYSNWASIQIAGKFHGKFLRTDGSLADEGENIVLKDGLGNTILDFEYKDGWYDITDGEDYSLTLIDPTAATNTWNDSASWRASALVGGTPGEAALDFPSPRDLVINEALTHQDDDTPGDWIELHNRSTNPLDINGWFLSDDEDLLSKVELNGLSPIAPGDYLVLTEASHFGITVAGTNGFALSELGDSIHLSSGAGGELTGYRTKEKFGAAERDVTFGLHVKSDGTTDFTAQSTQTFGAANADPLIGDVVITEIMYHPANSNAFEYIELCNRTTSDIPLYDVNVPSNVWKLNGAVEFSFPAGMVLEPDECIVISETNAAAFGAYYTLDPNITVLGPYDGRLNNSGEDLYLVRPGDPEALTGEVPEILVEWVNYDDEFPWLTDADGLGSSLERLGRSLYPNDASNWGDSNTAVEPAFVVGVTNRGSPPATVADIIAQNLNQTNLDKQRVVKWDSDTNTGGAGQTFTATKDAIAYGIELKMHTVENFNQYAPASFKLKIFEGGLGSTRLLGTYSYDATGLPANTKGDWLHFGFGANGVAMASGTVYTFTIVNGENNSAHNLGFQRTNVDTDYPDGNEVLLGNGYDVANFDINPWGNGTSQPAEDTGGDLLFSVVGTTSGGETDTDDDGLTDAQENALGTDPNNPNSVFKIDEGTALPVSGKMHLEWVSKTGVFYRVKESPDLTNWTITRDWAAAQTPPLDTLDFDLTPSNAFFKIEAEIQ